MKKLVSLFAAIALTAVCMTPTPLYAANEQPTQTKETVSNTVAEINGKAYTTLSEAINAVEENQTIKLVSNIEVEKTIDVNNKVFTLELNGKTITQPLINGKIGDTPAPIRLFNSSLTINDSVGNGSIFGYQCAVGVFVDSSLTLNNGELKGEWYGLAGNGANNNGTNIVINGGSISNADKDKTGAAIYHPQTGSITINGGSIVGDLGIQLCAGNLSVMNINGGIIKGTGPDERDSKKGDGAIPDGAAISVVNRPGYSSIPKVNITGGTFTSDNSEALLAYTWSEIEKGKWGKSDWVNAKDNVSVSGGSFNTDPSAYVSDSYKAFQTEAGFTVAPVATGIKLSDAEITLEENATKTITASLVPDGTLEAVKWSSDSKGVATVDEYGKITAVSAGKAVITAETESGIKADCTVIVIKPVKVNTPSIDTTQSSNEIKVGINDKNADDILMDVANKIIEGAKNFTDEKIAAEVVKAAKDGKTITVVADIKEANTNDATVKTDAEKIKKELEKSQNTATVAMYLDLSLIIKADETSIGNITNLDKPVKFTVVVPENLVKEGRNFYILRVHNGVVEKIEPDQENNILTFSTDKFSTYAVIYEDKKVDDVVTPEKERYNVVFVDMNGAVLKSEQVEANGSATAPKAPEVEGYRFVKWDTDYTKVTEDLLVKPVYEKVAATEKPASPDKPEKPSSDKKSPNTGDTTNAGLFTAFALLGLVSMGIIAVQRKRKQLIK